ncbi:hypothetical protein [Glaciibacter superstes]|nr:hypothetical protein [Glaciibacter superstes]
MKDDLELIDGEADDDDPEVIAGMEYLREVRAAEAELPAPWDVRRTT